MTTPKKHPPLPEAELKKALALESEGFERVFTWLETHLPPNFLEETDLPTRIVLARNLMNFEWQDRYIQIHLKHRAFVLCMDAPEMDLKILQNYGDYAIRYYRTYISNAPPPGEVTGALRIAILHLREMPTEKVERLKSEQKNELAQKIVQHNGGIDKQEAESILAGLAPHFIRSLSEERLQMALEVLFRAQKEDECQFKIAKNSAWKEKKKPSLSIVLAWRNVPKTGFLHRLARVIYAHGLALQKVSATYIDPYSTKSILILSIGLHGLKGGAAWEEADIDTLLQEICLLKYFQIDELTHQTFIEPKLLSGLEAHWLDPCISFVHQMLLHADPNLYSLENVKEGLFRHPELTALLYRAFEAKFHPKRHSQEKQKELETRLLDLIEKLDTGHATNDLRRKNIFKQSLSFIRSTLKTNFYLPNKSSFSFRLDATFLEQVPFQRKEKFPELPFALFFIYGMHFVGFQIRFRDLARGGVRTVIPDRWEAYFQERNHIFAEAYNLALTQQKKNKDIPEGGSKTAILLAPFDVFSEEEAMFRREMEEEGTPLRILEEKLKIFRREHKQAYLFASQRSFIQSLMTLINCDEEGRLKADSVIDHYGRPEYIYLGPDENMLNEMIIWIANYSIQCGYKPGQSFMSSKPGAGINHKQYGVTSYGVHVYLQQTLQFLQIDPTRDPFTVKVSGGPDGDVAGNELHLLATHYPKTAKLLALTDVSGTIFDPLGLDWTEIDTLFKTSQPISRYPAKKLNPGGFLLDLQTKKQEGAYTQQTLCWKKEGSNLVETWLSGSDMNHLYRTNVHQTKTDLFIPGGGRPRTLNESNITTYLDEKGEPTSKAIVEGANLYLTAGARRFLEKLNVIVLKDSSCNKGGVICSSLEVLAGLCLSEEEFLAEKEQYVKEVLEIIRTAALQEANLILNTHRTTGAFYTDISERISEQINLFKYQLLDHLEPLSLSQDPTDPLIRCLFRYCPPLLRTRYPKRILAIPAIHQKAMIAVFLASHLVYARGLDWGPSIADVLHTVVNDPGVVGA